MAPILAVGVLIPTLAGVWTAHAKGVTQRSFEPAPPNSAYASVWAGVETIVTLRFADPLLTPVGPLEVCFALNDGAAQPTQVRAAARRTAPDTWQATFLLPRPGTWNMSYDTSCTGPDGRWYFGFTFALQALPGRQLVGVVPALGLGLTAGAGLLVAQVWRLRLAGEGRRRPRRAAPSGPAEA